MGANPLGGPAALIDVLREIYSHPKRLQSNFARDHAHAIARLASCGLISTELPPASGMYGYHWRVTMKGLRVLELTEETE